MNSTDRTPMMLDGLQVLFTIDEARAAVNRLDAESWEHTKAAAQRIATAGWIMLQMAAGVRYGAYERIATRFGVNAKRAGRMRDYANAFIDPGTGSFDEDAWFESERKAKEAHKSGLHRTKTGADGEPEPSRSAIEMAAGIRKYPNKVPNENPQRGDLVRDDPNNHADDDQDEHDDANAETGADDIDGLSLEEALDLPVQIGGAGRRSVFERGPAGVVGGAQLELDFRPAELGRKVAALSVNAERRLLELDDAARHRLAHLYDELIRELDGIAA